MCNNMFVSQLVRLQLIEIQPHVQAEKEHPGGHTPVRSDQACGRHARLRQPAQRRRAAGGRGPERVGGGQQ